MNTDVAAGTTSCEVVTIDKPPARSVHYTDYSETSGAIPRPTATPTAGSARGAALPGPAGEGNTP